MKPATPLPWHDLYLNWVQPSKGATNVDQRELPQNNRFALHACNAYPKLVKALSDAAPLVARSDDPEEFYSLLRELGELK